MGNDRIEGAIFDCDGTLLDSLGAWRGLETVLADAVRVQVSDEERRLFTTFTIPEVARYFHERYGFARSVDAVIAFIDDYMMDYYALKARPLPGVVEFLEVCSRAGVKMCVASSSAQMYLQAGLKGSGIAEYFSYVFSVEDFNSSKREPVVFERAQAALGTSRARTWGIDDSAYALETLKSVGFPTIGVCDPKAETVPDAIDAASDVVVLRLDELMIREGRIMKR